MKQPGGYKTKQKEQILRNQVSRIFVNQITGDITDVPPVGVYREPPRGEVYLNEVYPLSLEFLRERFDTLASIYRESRLERVAFRSGLVEEAELYRILDISYHTLSYIREYSFVYLNQEDGSLAFQFHSGIQAYSNALADQISARANGARNLFSQPSRLCEAAEIRPELPARLIEALTAVGKADERLPVIEAEYYKDRALLDGELADILRHCSMFKAERILIRVPYLGEYLTGDAIAEILSTHTKEVIIEYSATDAQAKKLIGTIRERAAKRKDFKLVARTSRSIASIGLYFGNMCAIQGQYASRDTIYRLHLYKLCAQVTFDSERIEKLWDTVAL